MLLGMAPVEAPGFMDPVHGVEFLGRVLAPLFPVEPLCIFTSVELRIDTCPSGGVTLLSVRFSEFTS